MSENVEDIGTEILDEDFAEVNQYQIEEDEDAILVHNWEDKHYGGRDECVGRDELEDEEDNKMEEMMIPWVIMTYSNMKCLGIERIIIKF